MGHRLQYKLVYSRISEPSTWYHMKKSYFCTNNESFQFTKKEKNTHDILVVFYPSKNIEGHPKIGTPTLSSPLSPLVEYQHFGLLSTELSQHSWIFFKLIAARRIMTTVAVVGHQKSIYVLFFFSSCRARSRLGRSSKRLVVDQLFSRCKRTGEKQKARCLPKSKQNQPQTQTQPKQKTTEEDTQKPK